MAETPQAEDFEQYKAIAEQVYSGVIDGFIKSDSSKAVATFIADVVGRVLALGIAATSPIGIGLAKGVAASEDLVAPALAEIAAAAASDMFGVDVSPSAFAQKRNRGGRNHAASALGAGIINQIKGQGGALEPSDEAAKRYLTMVLNMALEGWYQGWFFELMTSLVPYFDVGKIESFAELDDTLAQVLGLGRITRSVLRPITDATIVTPLRWQVNKTYSPELLSPAQCARQIARKPADRAKWIEEIRKQGYSDERIEILLADAGRQISPGDVTRLVHANLITRAEAIARLQADGYSAADAQWSITADDIQRGDPYRQQLVTAAIGAFAARDIDSVDFAGVVDATLLDQSERTLARLAAEGRRALNIRRLTTSQVEAMVKSGVLSVLDYRRTAEREGYPPEDVIALELQLRYELDKQKSIEDHRREQEAERAEELAEKDRKAAAKRAEVEAERALRRRGPAGDLERAVVRGLIPLGRLEQVLGASYDPDTVAILVGLVEADRLAYLEQQAKRAEAEQRAARREIALADLEEAVLREEIDLGTYRDRLVLEKFDAGDVDILTRTLAGKLEDRRDAKRARDEAAEAAKRRSIDLGRFETLVRRGVRSREDYLALLEDLGFVEPARVAMLELLDLQIADDTRAREARAAAEARLRAKGLSLEQERRGVLLGARTPGQFEAFLVAQGFTADAINVLMAELQNALEEADAARERREEAARAAAEPVLALATVARAARLGVVSPDVYQARLVADGYSPADVAIELELLLLEIADMQAAREKRDAIERELRARGLSLGELARAVRLGVQPMAAYQARAAALGYAPEAVATLVGVLEEELAQAEEARRRKAAIDAELRPRALSVAQLENAVKRGLETVSGYVARLLALGYSDADAELLAALLVDELEQLEAARRRKAAIDAELRPRDLSVGQLEEAVTKGFETVADFAARVQALGYTPDDAELLAALLVVDLEAAADKAAGGGGG